MRPAPVFLVAVLLVSPILLAGVTVGPEREVTPPALHAAAFDQDSPTVAGDGTGWLAGWLSQGIFAATRVDSSGRIIDPTPIIIDDEASAASLAFDGTQYLAAWVTRDSIRVRLIDRNGGLTPSLDIARHNVSIFRMRVAWDGSRFIVAWTEARDAVSIRSAVLLDGSGTPASPVIRISSDGSLDFDVAAGTGEFALVDAVPDFSRIPDGNGYPSSVRLMRLKDDGSMIGRIAVSDANTAVFNPLVTFDGRQYLVVWSSNVELSGVTAGAFVSSSVEVRRLSDLYAGDETVGTLTWTGAEYLVTLMRTDRVDVLRLDTTGVASSQLNPVLIDSANPTWRNIDAAWNGTHLLLAIGASGDVVERFVTASGEIADPVAGAQRATFLDAAAPAAPLALSSNRQEAPAIASAARGEMLVVWTETVTQPMRSDFVAMPFSNGIPLLEEPRRVGSIVGRGSIATDGEQYVVVWTDEKGALVGQRFDRAGAPLSSPVTIAAYHSSLGRAAVTFDGETFLVAYEEGAGCTHGASFEQVVARLTRTGEVVSADPVRTSVSTCFSDSSLAPGPDGALLAVNGFLPGRSTGAFAVFISRGGTAAPPVLLPFQIASDLRISWTGSVFLVTNGTEWATLTPGGTLFSHGITTDTPCALTTFTNGVVAVLGSDDVYASCFADDGESLGTTSVSATEFTERAPSIAILDDRHAEIVYQRTVDSPGVSGLTRLFVRSLTLPGIPLHRRATH